MAAERDPSQLMFFVVMIPVCYWLAIPLGRGAAGVLEGAFVGVFVDGDSSSCWNGKRRAPVWNAPPDPDRSFGDQNHRCLSEPMPV